MIRFWLRLRLRMRLRLRFRLGHTLPNCLITLHVPQCSNMFMAMQQHECNDVTIHANSWECLNRYCMSVHHPHLRGAAKGAVCGRAPQI